MPFLSEADGASFSSLDRPTRLRLSTSQRVRLARASTSLLASSTRLQLSVFSNWKGVAVRKRFERRADGILWSGQIEGDKLSSVLFVVRNGRLTGHLNTTGGEFVLQSVGVPQGSASGRGAGDDVVAISQPEKMSGDWCGDAHAPVPASRSQAASGAGRGSAAPRAVGDPSVDETTIDMMFVYSPQAKAYDPNIEASLQFTIDDANDIFTRTGVATRLRLVHTAQVNYQDGATLAIDLNRVTNKNDGFMDNVHQLRDEYGADLVCFVPARAAGGAAGVAWGMYRGLVNPEFEDHGFSVVAADQLLWAFAHEVGHNMGSAHDHVTDANQTPAFDYSFGHYNLDKKFFTIMSYTTACDNAKISCRRVNTFSNPDVTDSGVPIGIAEGQNNAADNRKTFTNTTPLVAAFRSSRPSILVSSASVVEGNSGTQSLAFTVGRSAPVAKALTVSYAFTDITATNGVDYEGKSGSVTFAAGEQRKTILIPIKSDTVYEGDEAFAIDFTAAPGEVIANKRVTVTIVEDDNPTLTFTGGQMVEGDGEALPQMAFKFKMDPPQARLSQVRYTTQDISTQSGIDYYPTTGTLEFGANQTEATVLVPVRGDNIAEPDETFELVLSNPVNLTLAQTRAQGTIINDDIPSINVFDTLTREGSEGNAAKFNVTLSMAWPTPVSVAYATTDGTAGSTDYTPQSGRITFAAGETTKTISVPLVDDLTVETDKVFSVRLSDAQGGRIEDGDAVARIQDNDSPGVTVFDAQEVEGNGAESATRYLRFDVALDAALPTASTVFYSTRDGSATAGADYDATSGTLMFAAGQTTAQVLVPIRGDLQVEGSETLQLVLSAPGGLRIARESATGTIADDDVPALSISDASVREARGGSNATFTVSLSNPWPTPISVAFGTSSGTAGTADYTQQSGRLVFEPGQTSKSITVRVLDDTLFEASEAFSVRLSDAQGGRIEDSEGIGTIASDDSQPTLSISSASKAEGNSGISYLEFPVKLSSASSERITVAYRTVAGTASAGSDFRAVSGSAVLAAGAVATTIRVPIVGDTAIEKDEAFSIQLLQPVNARLASASAVGTIQNDDRDSAAPAITILSPRSGATSTTWPVLSGQATDANGLTRVTVRLQRVSDGRYWNGGGWAVASDPRTTFEAARVGSGTSARWSLALTPPVAQTQSGQYRVTANAYDAAANKGEANVVFNIDKSGPTVAITSPSDRSVLRALSAVAGTASDVPGGVSKVEVSIVRRSDSKSWNGRAWVAGTVLLRATLSGSSWRVVSLPSQWSAGAYSITARATDKMGNASDKAASITVASNAAA